jgi:hypothetical protein
MADTPNLVLPLIAANQAQKNVTHNSALRRLDSMVQMSVIDRNLTAPPGSPAEGDRYIVASGATGAWASWDYNVAAYLDGAWVKLVPRTGWLAWVVDESILVAYKPAPNYWVDAIGAIGTLNLTGVNFGQDTLNFYDEGIWTPVLAFGGNSVGITYAASGQLGRYTRIGRHVSVTGFITLTSKGSSVGAATITGLPYTSLNDGMSGAGKVGFASGFSGVTGAVLCAVPANTTRFNVYGSGSGAAVALTNSNFTNSTVMVFGAEYDV